MLNLAVQAVNQTAYPNQNKQGFSSLSDRNKQERAKRKDQPWRRLATKNKIAQVKGWNLPNYREKRTLNELLEKFGEYSYLTGKRLGTYYLSTLDLDIWREEFPNERVNYLEKSVRKLLDCLGVSYDKTKRGLHIDILTPNPLTNELIYWTDKLGKKWNIGSIQSQGKYVVGEDKNKTFIKNGKWYWKALNEEVKAVLNKFFFKVGAEKPLTAETILEPKKSPLLPLLSNLNIQKPKPIIQAKILSKQKIPWLTDIWKVFYLDFKSKQTGYFLANGYTQKKLNWFKPWSSKKILG